MCKKYTGGGYSKNTKEIKRGFTLIELLAVIVILSIVALIAVPVINSVMEKSKKKAAVVSTYGYVKAIEEQNALSQIDNITYPLIEGENLSVTEINDKVQVKGKKPLIGTITVLGNEVKTANLITGGYNVFYDGIEAIVIGKSDYEEELKESIISTTTNTTTKSIKVNYSIEDEYGIKEVKCYYKDTDGYKEVSLNDKKANVGTCNIDNLEKDKNYDYKIEVINKVNKTAIKIGTARTVNMQTPSIGYKNNNGATWTTKKVLEITAIEEEGTYLEYQIDGHEDNNWETLNNNEIEVTENGTIYVRLYDGKNSSGEATLTITKIDKTEPTNTAPSTVVDTNSITVTNYQDDEESGIVGLEYGISETENGTYTWQTSNVFSGKEKNKTYYIKTRVNNNARVNSGITEKIESLVRETSTKEFTSPTIEVDNTNWAGEHTFTATYTKGEITNAYYYIRSTVASTLKTNTTIKACTSLSGTTKDCSGTEISQNGTLTANTWYQVSVTSLQVELKDNGSVYVAVSDGTNLLDTPTATTSKIDKIPPTVEAGTGNISTTTSTATVPIKVTDNEIGTIGSVKCEYKLSTETNYVTTNATGTTTSCSFTGLLSNKTYNFRITAKDSLNNETAVSDAYTGSFNTTNIDNPTTALNITENTSACSKSKTMTVTGALSGTQLQYRIGSNGTWTNINSGGTFTLTQNNTIYARLYDGVNETTSTNYKTFTVTTYDATAVTTTAPTTSNVTTSSVTLTNKQTDNCNLNLSTLEYGYSTSENGTYTWGSNATITGLSSGTTYYFKTRINDTAANGLTESNVVSAKTIYKEAILNGADPVYNSNLVPVTISIENGTTIVKKADITSNWYSYQNKQWANAVILKTSTSYTNNQSIPLSNIESYFVWIPRYAYQIFDLGEYSSANSGAPTTLGSEAKTIQIKFGTSTTSDSNNNECTTPVEAGTKGNCQVGDYMTHPAFLTMNTNGLWVGKYETGYDGATTTGEAQVNSSDSSKIIVQPDVYSWRSITVKNAFTASYNYLRDNDSHMMKNTEWGAVAYLSHSVYGINTEVNINNNSSYKTGYSAVDGTDQSSYPGTYGTDSSKTLAYNTTTGLKASTTGNITGIYDMSGGAWEYMASYRADTLGSSGFASSDTYMGSAYSKYFDVYPSDSSTTTYGKRILGDATGEMGPFYNYKDNDNNSRYHNNWYADYSTFVVSSGPWFVRGGNCSDGVLAGQFNFFRSTGGTCSYAGFRLVLAD